MNKILKIALEAKGFKPETIVGLLEVCEATGNSIVSIEKILGIYEAPIVNEISTSQYRDNRECRIVSYNPFSNEVIYSCLEPKTKWNEETRKHEVIEGEFYNQQNSTSLENWQREKY